VEERSHREYKVYRNHNYPYKDGTSDCSFGCGCWMGSSRSGSRFAGVDPFGKCPNNYVYDGLDLNFDQNLEDFINGRICFLESEIYRLKKFEELYNNSTSTAKIKIVKENSELKSQLRKIVSDISKHVNKNHDQLNELKSTLVEASDFLK